MIRVLVITYSWPPTGGSGVQRWLKFVKYFRNFGVEPVIYTPENPDVADRDTSFLKEIPLGIEVLKQPICEPYPFIHSVIWKCSRIFSLLTKALTFGFISKKWHFFSSLSAYVFANFFIPDHFKFWIRPSVKYLSSYLKKNHIDLIITTGPPHTIHLIGEKLKERTGVKWIADFRDPWVERLEYERLSLSKRGYRKHCLLEEKVLKNADAVTIVFPRFQKKYLNHNSNVQVIFNGYDNMLLRTSVSLTGAFTISHIGTCYKDGVPYTLLNVLKRVCAKNSLFTNDLRIRFVGRLSVDIKEIVKKYGLESHLEIIDYVPHDQLGIYQRESQLLLLLIPNWPTAKAVLTGKLFEYLSARRPILGVGPIDGDAANILNETNAGVMIDYDDEVEMEKVILSYYDQYKKGNLSIDSKNIEQYHRKALTEKMANLIKNVCQSDIKLS